MLTQHNLDDMRFAQIAEAARLKAPEYFPPWNDLNAHDPGVTLIELFAWLTEMQRFHLSQIGGAGPFFPLLGITPRYASAAEVDITVKGGFAPQYIPRGTPLYAEDVRFETAEDAHYTGAPLSLHAIQREALRTPIPLGVARGFPHESFTVDAMGQTILRQGFSLTVAGLEWQLVDSFRASNPTDRHFTLNDESGEVKFGDGFCGALPIGEVIVMAMAITRCADGNIAQDRIPALGSLPVLQPHPAKGGAAQETAAQSLARAKLSHRQAVTARDIEELVAETPGIEAEDVSVFEEGVCETGKPRIIYIAVKLKSGAVSDAVKHCICRHLEPYRLACRDFRIIQPTVARVALIVEARGGPRSKGFVGELEQSIKDYFQNNLSGFGAEIRVSLLRAHIAKRPEILAVTTCSLRGYGGARVEAGGDICLSPGTYARLDELSIRIIDA